MVVLGHREVHRALSAGFVSYNTHHYNKGSPFTNFLTICELLHCCPSYRRWTLPDLTPITVATTMSISSLVMWQDSLARLRTSLTSLQIGVCFVNAVPAVMGMESLLDTSNLMWMTLVLLHRCPPLQLSVHCPLRIPALGKRHFVQCIYVYM